MSSLDHNEPTRRGLMTHSQWILSSLIHIAVCNTPSHYPNQYILIVNWILSNKHQCIKTQKLFSKKVSPANWWPFSSCPGVFIVWCELAQVISCRQQPLMISAPWTMGAKQMLTWLRYSCMDQKVMNGCTIDLRAEFMARICTRIASDMSMVVERR